MSAIPLLADGPWGWLCEDCLFFTTSEAEAFRHSDDRRHSLAVCSETIARKLQRERYPVQRQDSLTDQMRDVHDHAIRTGCYDAAEWIRRRFFDEMARWEDESLGPLPSRTWPG